MTRGQNDQPNEAVAADAAPDGTAQERATWERRRVLAGVGVLVAVGAVGVTASAAPAPTTLTVWKLELDWGYPRGPHSKTRLHSRASRRAATHRYALTAGDAESMNLHECSWAPATAHTVDAAAFTHLWHQLSYDWTSPWTGDSIRIFDDRHVDRIRGGEESLRLALGAQMQTPNPPGSSTAGGSGAAADQGTRFVAAGDAGATARDRAEPSSLAVPGSDPRMLVTGAAAAVAAGVVALRARRAVGRDAAPADPAAAVVDS